MSLISFFRSHSVPVCLHAGVTHDNTACPDQTLSVLLHPRKHFNSIPYTPQATAVAATAPKPSRTQEIKPSFGTATTQAYPVAQSQVVEPTLPEYPMAIQPRTQKHFIGATKESRTTEVTATTTKPISNVGVKPCSRQPTSKTHPPTHPQATSPIYPKSPMTIQLRRPKHPICIPNIPQTSAASLSTFDLTDARIVMSSSTNFIVTAYPTTQSPENVPTHPDGTMSIQLHTPNYHRGTDVFPTAVAFVNTPTLVGTVTIKPSLVASTIPIHPTAQSPAMDSIGPNHLMAIQLRRTQHYLCIVNISQTPGVSAAERQPTATVFTKPGFAKLVTNGNPITPSRGDTPVYPNDHMAIELRTPKPNIRASAVPRTTTALVAPSRPIDPFTIKLRAMKARDSGVEAEPHEQVDRLTHPAKCSALDLTAANCLVPFGHAVETHEWLPKALKKQCSYRRALLRIIEQVLPVFTAIASAVFVYYPA
ncbi:hypothetical protein BJ085DRAFT_28730 [Dimargaris cristalligena]|uniref:Uncharacterized protein n=1 Tax=Dimargaris cristalligena TaxID=215637 RepID=A0A4P9ZMP0_9FUNG|nr:hypothetical protein BJ085DRAFT_28730 [Dimargaris cristalligena]|eukprot:RKP33792.1 hypothetical protein BJ085DRAFT_28730 [Dimargaris cristalligena]